MNPVASAGRMPANVSEAARASVTTGLANEVEAVNQYAAVMWAPTAKGTAAERSRAHPLMIERRPNVATNSLKSCAPPLRTWRDAENRGSLNIR